MFLKSRTSIPWLLANRHSQIGSVLIFPFTIRCRLLGPEIRPGPPQPVARAVERMSKATVNKAHYAMFWRHGIGAPGQMLPMETDPKAVKMQQYPETLPRFGIAPFHARLHRAKFLLRDDIRHHSPPTPGRGTMPPVHHMVQPCRAIRSVCSTTPGAHEGSWHGCRGPTPRTPIAVWLESTPYRGQAH